MTKEKYEVSINDKGSIDKNITFTVDSDATFEMDGKVFKFADIKHISIREIQERNKLINPEDYFLHSKGKKKI